MGADGVAQVARTIAVINNKGGVGKTTTAATLVPVAAVVAVLAVVVVVVEIRVETLFLLVLEEAGTLVFLIFQLGSRRCYGITDVGIRRLT